VGELLLELLSEEIPARMQRSAIEDLTALVRDKLAAAEIAAQTLRGFVTPRRLTVIADGIPAQQPDRSDERRGPRVGAPQPALDGFLRAAGLDSIGQCEIRDTGRGEFYFAVLARPGRAAAEVLPELLREAIGELSWPKSMRYPASSLRWVRPLVSVICLFDGAVLPLPLDQVPVGRTTRGHRFMSDGEITVDDAGDYLEKLETAHVILDPDRRRDLIAADLDRLAAAEGLTVKPDPALLDEVTGLVEYPVVLMGRIDEEFVRPLPEGLPPEVLATAMRTHQKYFSCLKADGTPAPRFLFVANNLAPDGGKTIIAGNERVLRARLADARFFWDQDRKVRLEDRVEALKQRVYYDKLGNMYEKAERVEQLAGEIASLAYPSEPDLRGRAARAALLAKGDLSTGMVGEFPELQGIMGRYYALEAPSPVGREDQRVADAIADHYKPLGPNDTCPTGRVSIVVALADKIDALVGFFGITEKPTGSRDPFALRRAALGVIRLIVENSLRLPLTTVFKKSFQSWRDQILSQRFIGVGPFGIVDATDELLEFIADRLKVHLRETGVRHDLIAAAFSNSRAPGSLLPSEITASVIATSAPTGVLEDDLVRLLARVEALSKFLATDDGSNLLVAYRRAANIVAIEERRDRRPYNEPVNPSRLEQPEESALWHRLSAMSVMLDGFLAAEHYDRVMGRLATLREPVDAFFDAVTVNTSDAQLRENRLRLLSRIRAVMNQVADFSQIEG
jgi:glycyl-tRNA synthetase beta chain